MESAGYTSGRKTFNFYYFYIRLTRTYVSDGALLSVVVHSARATAAVTTIYNVWIIFDDFFNAAFLAISQTCGRRLQALNRQLEGRAVVDYYHSKHYLG